MIRNGAKLRFYQVSNDQHGSIDAAAVWIVNHEGGDIAWTSSVRIPNLISVELGNPGVTI